MNAVENVLKDAELLRLRPITEEQSSGGVFATVGAGQSSRTY